MRVLDAEAMREVDRRAIEELGIPSVVLMENAALGVVEALVAEFPEARSVAVLCGPGNNGGDGLAVARHLAIRGFEVFAALLVGGDELRGDAARQVGICRAMGLPLEEFLEEGSVGGLVERVVRYDCVVDALFGTGLSRPLGGRFAALVAALGERDLPVVAVDVPSGLSGSQAAVPGPVLRAQVTVALGALKLPHVLPPASALVGRVAVAELGIPGALVERAAGDLHLLTGSDLALRLAPRDPDSHKGDYGHVLVVGGSPGKTGAVALAARGALRIGAGLVSAAVPESLTSVVDAASTESMTLGLPELDEGIGPGAEPVLSAACGDKDAVAVGPGAGRSEPVAATLREFVRKLELPVVVDADGLNAFAGRLEELAGRSAPIVLTPHAAELARLLGTTTETVRADRLEAVRRACALSGAVVVLKGHRSLIADPLGGVYVNPTGNAGMASGGTGDVLTGMVVGLLGQGQDALSAACLGVFLHGDAGDRAAARIGEVSLTAGDLLAEIAPACLELARL